MWRVAAGSAGGTGEDIDMDAWADSEETGEQYEEGGDREVEGRD